MYKKLVIVSDTAIYRYNNKIFAFNAVVNEINHFEQFFTEIVWIGIDRTDIMGNQTMQEISSKKLKVVLLKNIGGKNLTSMFKILFNYPLMFFVIIKHIWGASVVHTRAPSHPAFIALLLSFIVPQKKWWHKFAGNWDTATLPFFYKLQRNILNKAKHSSVTINGFWDNQPAHCLSFENPCLTPTDITAGINATNHKKFTTPFTFVFVGRLDSAKGVDQIITALKQIPAAVINKVHFIGNGDKINFYKNECAFLTDKVHFHGFLAKDGVHQLLAQSDFILLPSKSEGFPKVVAEAACYGTIPIVSDVGSLPHYINSSNGFVWIIKSEKSFTEIMQVAVNTDADILQKMSRNCLLLAEKFTFAAYLQNLQTNILKDN